MGDLNGGGNVLPCMKRVKVFTGTASDRHDSGPYHVTLVLPGRVVERYCTLYIPLSIRT